MVKSSIVKLIFVFFKLFTYLLLFLYTISSILPWINATWFWPIAFCSFLFPYLLISLIICLLIWIFINKRKALLILIILHFGYKQISSLIVFNKTEFIEIKPENSIRVVSWNIANMDGKTKKENAKKHKVQEIIEFLNSQDADVVCVQEFDDCSKNCKSLELVLKKYQYYYFPRWVVGPHFHKSGNVIFSKYPIIKNDITSYANGENIIRSDIAIRNDTISFFTTHLSSYIFSKEEFTEINETKQIHQFEKKQQKQILKKLKNTLKAHVREAEIAHYFMKKTKYPSVFTADLNEVATSNIYWKVRGNKQDAFLEKGNGFGKTYNSLWPILRIDVLLTDKKFAIHQFKVKETELSDHNLLVADIELIK